MTQDYKQQIKDAVLHESSFVRLTAKGPVRGGPALWRRVVVRPIEIKSGRHLQFSYFDERQDTTKNFRGDEATERLDELLAIAWATLAVETTGDTFQVQLTKKGRPIVHRSRGEKAATIELRHDARKDLPLPAERPDQFLIGLGIMNPQGTVNPSMADKFAQINEFLKLLEHTGTLDAIGSRPIGILDAGCGSSYLSFAVYHFLNRIRGIPAMLTGVDHNAKLIEKSNRLAADLGFAMGFEATPISRYQPPTAPDILLALHACDTATDDALALGIRQHASLIMAVPCCHHHLHAQLGTAEPFGPVMQHGILRKRFADILTDTFRAQILRLCGYRTDAVEFVSSEHTDRNLLLRAVRRRVEPEEASGRPEQRMFREYEALKQFWNVTPYLETLLRREGLWKWDAPAPPVVVSADAWNGD